jgi:hypothetical protein
MLPTSPSRRFAAVVALVVGPVLAGASAVTQPDLSGTPAQQLSAIADSALAPVSAVLFVVSQLAMLVAVLAIGRLVAERAPRLSAWGTALGVLGAFGHSVFGGVTLTWLVMARDAGHRAAYADLFHDLQDSPAMMFSVAGLLGTVVGLVLLGVALFRTRVVPRWVGPALWAFVVVEFAGGAVSSSASYASTALLLAAFWAIAAQLRADAGAAVEAPELVTTPAG